MILVISFLKIQQTFTQQVQISQRRETVRMNNFNTMRDFAVSGKMDKLMAEQTKSRRINELDLTYAICYFSLLTINKAVSGGLLNSALGLAQPIMQKLKMRNEFEMTILST